MKRLMVWEPALAANDKHTLISSVAESLAQQGVVSFGEQDALVEALVAREDLGNTLIATNTAIPHATCPAVTEGASVYLKLAEPLLDWSEGAAVDRFVFTVVPEQPSADDGEAVKRFFTSLADDAVLNVFSTGSQESVTQIFQ